jgi:hypothetical protein
VDPTTKHNGTRSLKFWGEYSYVEILNNHWDSDLSGWADAYDAGQTFDGANSINTCARDVYITNNKI